MASASPRTTPGVYREDVLRAPAPRRESAVPVFLGAVGGGGPRVPVRVAVWEQYATAFGAESDAGYLTAAVRGFFANGGRVCWVVPLADAAGAAAIPALRAGLDAAAALDEPDLVCAPDVMRPRRPGEPPNAGDVEAMQRDVLEHCDRAADRFAILDSLPGLGDVDVLAQRRTLSSPNGALYHPWLLAEPEARFVPPCGHVAGIYARSDARAGVHKAPANERVEGVLDVEREIDDAQQAGLHPEGVNCLRSFPARGIRVWGARTLGRPPWEHVGVRRLLIQIVRWLERATAELVFEPLNDTLFARAERELNVYLETLFRSGAFAGAAAEESYFVRCDASVNPPEVRAAGQLVVEIGFAPVLPNEFIVIRVVHEAGGVHVAAPL